MEGAHPLQVPVKPQSCCPVPEYHLTYQPQRWETTSPGSHSRSAELGPEPRSSGWRSQGQGINRGTGCCLMEGMPEWPEARAMVWTLGHGCHSSSGDYWGPDKRKLGRCSWGVSPQGRATIPTFLLSLNPFLSEHLPTSEPLSLNSWSGVLLSEPSPLFQLLLSPSPAPPLISTPSLGKDAREAGRGRSPRHQ